VSGLTEAGALGIYRRVILLFGVLHILFSALGLYVTFVTIRSVDFLRDDPSAPHVVESFYVMTVINVLLVAATSLAG